VIDEKSALRSKFETKVKLETWFNEENRSLRNVVMAVDSKCSVFSDVKFRNEDGTDPAGTIPLPIISKDCIQTRPPNSAGKVAGTPGNVSPKELTLPELSQPTPLHVQKLTSVDQPPLLKLL